MSALWESIWEWLRLRKIDIEVSLFRRLLRSRFAMSFYRRFPRLAKLDPGRLIVHYADAIDALEHGRRFGVPYLAKMEELGGPFVLGLDDGPEHTRLRGAVKGAIAASDFDALHEQSRGRADALLAGRNRIEVVGELTDPVLAHTIGLHLGLGPVTIAQLKDARAVFRDIFINGLKDPRVSRRAREAADRLRDHVTAVVDERLGLPPDRGDILGRLIAGGELTRKELIDHGIGLLVAWSASVSRAMAFSMDALFKQEDGFALAREAAVRADRDAMTAVLWEAFRFVPPAPAVERVCRREAPLRKRLVRREADIIVTFTSAMMDGGAVQDPGRFRVDRPCREYLTFGHGSHSCLGRELAREQLTGLLIALFRRPNLEWAYGIKLEGPYPHRLEVTWQP
jgi:cytochrome P450